MARRSNSLWRCSPIQQGFVIALLLFGNGSAVLSAEDPIELTGVVVAGGTTTVCLRDKSSGASAWIDEGKQFEDYLISSYEAKDDSVALTKGGVTIRIRLDDTSLIEAPEPIQKLRKAVLQNLEYISAAADQYYLQTGTTHTTFRQLNFSSKDLRDKKLRTIDGEDYDLLDLSSGKALIITTASGVTVELKP